MNGNGNYTPLRVYHNGMGRKGQFRYWEIKEKKKRRTLNDILNITVLVRLLQLKEKIVIVLYNMRIRNALFTAQPLKFLHI